jgi:hypothetical protein
MFGIRHLIMVYGAAFDFVSNESVVCVEVRAVSSHIFFICFKFLDTGLTEPAQIAPGDTLVYHDKLFSSR